jgi:hypothetical protein
MKTKTIFLLAAVALLGIAAAVWSADKPGRTPTQEFMHDKLELSHKVLEGICEEDFDLVEAKSLKLAAMTKEASWQAFQNPRYEAQSLEFRRHVNALTRAAKDRDLDGATLAYLRMTMSCVDCHKLVRGKLVALAQP